MAMYAYMLNSLIHHGELLLTRCQLVARSSGCLEMRSAPCQRAAIFGGKLQCFIYMSISQQDSSVCAQEVDMCPFATCVHIVCTHKLKFCRSPPQRIFLHILQQIHICAWFSCIELMAVSETHICEIVLFFEAIYVYQQYIHTSRQIGTGMHF